MDFLSNEAFLKGIAIINIVWLAFVFGGAAVMYLFSIPVMEAADDNDAPNATWMMVHQFHHHIKLGIKYMQTGNNIRSLLLATQTYLFYRHPDPRIKNRWPWFAASLLIGVQAAWYEKVFVFPTNDELIEIEARLENSGPDADREARPKVLRLLEKWRNRHVGRIIIPLVALWAAVYGISF